MFDVCTTGDTTHIDYDIQFLASQAPTWVHRYASLLQWSVPLGHRVHVAMVGTRLPKGMDHCSSEEYRCTHVGACEARNCISYRCVSCHPWCTHRTSLFAKKNFFCFPVTANNSIKVGSLVSLLQMFVITENIMKRPVYIATSWSWATSKPKTCRCVVTQ
jgi:hypothetical protein